MPFSLCSLQLAVVELERGAKVAMGACHSKEEVEAHLAAAEEDIKQEFELSKQALKDWIDRLMLFDASCVCSMCNG